MGRGFVFCTSLKTWIWVGRPDCKDTCSSVHLTLAFLQPRWDAENPQKLVVHLAWHMHQGTRDPISNRVGSKDQHPKLFPISTCAPWQACAHTHRHKHTQIYKCIKILKRKWGMCLMSVTPALKRHKQADLCEFNTI